MSEAQTTIGSLLAEAYEMGRDAGRAAATWSCDGNSDINERRRVLAMLNDGDPEAYDYLPNTPNLSGEWADDPTPNSLAYDLGYSAGDEDVISQIAEEWERGVSETFMTACERELIKFCE